MKLIKINICLLFLLFSCHDSHNHEWGNSLPREQEFIEVINAILTQDNSYNSKKKIISNRLPKCIIHFHENKKGHQIPKYPHPFGIGFESLIYFGLTDSIYFNRQNQDTRNIFLKQLNTYDCTIVDIKNIPMDSVNSLIYTEFSLPIFSKDKKLAFVQSQLIGQISCGTGARKGFIIKFENKKWILKEINMN